MKEERGDRDKRECDRKSIKRKKKGEEGPRMPMKKGEGRKWGKKGRKKR